MSDHIVITKDAITVHRFEDNSIEQIIEPIEDETSLTHLREICKIADNVTLGDIFSHVEKLPLLKFFISQYSWCSAIDEFHEQAKLPRVDRDDGEVLDFLEIYHGIERNYLVEKITHTGGNRERRCVVDYDSSPDFHGIGTSSRDEYGLKVGDRITWSVSYGPMNEIAHLPVRLNDAFEVFEPWDSRRHDKNHRPEKMISKTRPFTLLEVLDAIYWDISFCGGPADNAAHMEHLREMSEGIKNGTIETIPWEEAFKDVLESLEGDAE